MSALTAIAPSLDEMYLTAEKCFADLPDFMRKAAGDVRIIVMDYAENETLDEMGIEDALELTGLYVGVPLTIESVTNPSEYRPIIYLYRLPILFEWAARGDVTVEELVSHVFIHELGHHFGWSDEEMDAKLEEDD
ncbi:metallopeptidase family protein [Hyphomonas sp. NPDC076900]|uniref:metallopeptidase family protein n=1 Tax=unclassified Hyphomonas TaxID=2630699 RepID=UPI003D08C3C4